ncbi:protein CURVATURE THYLAKOID 1C, chloroplastic-like [Prunus dulcis]|uniref:protein CURVATURE THYLAKOID 1C, chloroplastic-like n=1 Tax=Prunus dulcis TaxID=3755 RepID=UPI0014826E48|nr:protein CURVATURE THYLAKOID 1C, chloroplastic-like [Prunus dulcis]
MGTPKLSDLGLEQSRDGWPTGKFLAEVATAEFPEIVKAVQEAWEKVEDKYAVSSLAVAGAVALWGSTGLISAIDRLPSVPGVLDLALSYFLSTAFLMYLCSGLHTRTLYSNQTGEYNLLQKPLLEYISSFY